MCKIRLDQKSSEKQTREKEPLEIQILRLTHINFNIIKDVQGLNDKKKNFVRELKTIFKN